MVGGEISERKIVKEIFRIAICNPRLFSNWR